MYNGIKIAIEMCLHVYIYMILVSGHELLYMVYVFSCVSIVCAHVCVCVCTCSCKPQHSLAEHNTHCMSKPRLRASVDPVLLETAPTKTPQSIANGELLQMYLFDLSSRYCNKVALLWSLLRQSLKLGVS